MVGDHRGGIETFLLKMNEYMGEDTIFDYVIEENTCIHEETIKARGGKVYYISSRHSEPIKNLRDNAALFSRLKGEVGAVYFNLSSLSWIEPIRLAVRMGYRVFVHSHNAEFIKANGSPLYRLVNQVNKSRLHRMNVTRLTCSVPATKFMFCDGDAVTMIYNAIQVEKFQYNAAVRQEQRRKLGLADDTLVLGFVGRIQYQKNPLYLPVILENVRKEHPNVFLLVVGEGDLRENLSASLREKGLTERAKLLGNISNVNEVMQAMDALVLPSRHEGLPYVMVEAQAAGLPCFVADTITTEAKIIEPVFYLPLSDSGEEWTETILGFFEENRPERETYSGIVKNSSFNIKVEARKLEGILTGGN